MSKCLLYRVHEASVQPSERQGAAVVEAVMERGGTGWRAVLGEGTGVVQASLPHFLPGGDGSPSLDFSESHTVEASHPRLIIEKTVLSNAFSLIRNYQITLSDHTRKLLSLFHMVLLPVDHLVDPLPYSPHVAYSDPC